MVPAAALMPWTFIVLSIGVVLGVTFGPWLRRDLAPDTAPRLRARTQGLCDAVKAAIHDQGRQPAMMTLDRRTTVDTLQDAGYGRHAVALNDCPGCTSVVVCDPDMPKLDWRQPVTFHADAEERLDADTATQVGHRGCKRDAEGHTTFSPRLRRIDLDTWPNQDHAPSVNDILGLTYGGRR